MFNFIFEGKIGEYLAPVMPTNQLFLAIQHHRNSEVQNFILTNQCNYRNNSDSGYAAIHVACRYNNSYAIELLAAQGNCDTFFYCAHSALLVLFINYQSIKINLQLGFKNTVFETLSRNYGDFGYFSVFRSVWLATIFLRCTPFFINQLERGLSLYLL